MKAFYQHDFVKEQCVLRHCLDYKLHFHHHIELVYMLEGSSLAIVDGTEYELNAGDILIVFPNQLHEYRASKDEHFFITIFKPEILTEFKELFYNYVPEHSVFSPKENDIHTLEVLKTLPEIFASDNTYKDQSYRGILSAFFGELFSKIKLVKANSANLSVLKAMLNYCNENYLMDINLDHAANHLHVSKYYISHLINKKLNISFNEYINSLRIADAVHMLENGNTDITEISQKCGFNTVRTFNRAFRKVYGVAPTQYKKNKMQIVSKTYCS